MTLTEKDAKFRFCPLLTTPDGKLRFCQGSQCMMWRWLGDGPQEKTEGAKGFCGLAVAPVVNANAGPAGAKAIASGKTENPFG